MAILVIPTRAVRLVKTFEFEPSLWHFQKPDRMNKTVCGIIIASGRGWKYRNPASSRQFRKNRKWESKRIQDIKSSKRFCKTCLGAISFGP